MVYETLNERNVSEGLHVLFVYANDITGGIFMTSVLFALFIVVWLGSYFAAERLRGGDIAMSFAAAGFFVFGASLIMTFVPGLVHTYTVVIMLGVAVLGALWVLMTRSSD